MNLSNITFNNSTLKEARERSGMTQASVGAAINVCKTTITNFETGKTVPHGIPLLRLAMLFGLNLSDLVKETDVRDKRYLQSRNS